MSKLPTDLQIFECIYKTYVNELHDKTPSTVDRSAFIYIPIDVKHVASKLNANAHELFGRLYYHLDHKYRYKQENDSMVHLFAFSVGEDRHCINFPYLAAVLSEHRLEDRRNRWSVVISVISLTLASVALIAQIVGML